MPIYIYMYNEHKPLKMIKIHINIKSLKMIKFT